MLETIIKEFQKKLGEQKVFYDRDLLDSYAQDETSDLKGKPDLLVRATTTKDVQKTLKICDKYNLSVTPRGGGSGVTGGAVPVQGGVVLSLGKMNKIIEIDTANMIAVVEPGVILADLQKRVEEDGLMYPPDPASFEICSVGGNVAENAGGAKAVKYGVTKDYVLGLEFVLPSGEIMKTGGKVLKDVTGYNLLGILLGSEGTLAVITKIFLRLIPQPKYFKTLLIPFNSLEQAINLVNIILNGKLSPSTLEFMEEGAINLVADYLGDKVPFPQAKAYLLLEFDGLEEDYLWHQIEILSKIINMDLKKIIVAESKKQREGLWEIRRSIREGIKKQSSIFFAEDCVVPRAKIPEFILKIKNYLDLQGLRSVFFGHAGDGNIHINILKDQVPGDKWIKMVPEIKRNIYQQVVSMGGVLTGEHGIGFLRKNYLPLALSQAEIQLLKRIKAAFDPKNLLNPDKIF